MICGYRHLFLMLTLYLSKTVKACGLCGLIKQISYCNSNLMTELILFMINRCRKTESHFVLYWAAKGE